MGDTYIGRIIAFVFFLILSIICFVMGARAGFDAQVMLYPLGVMLFFFSLYQLFDYLEFRYHKKEALTGIYCICLAIGLFICSGILGQYVSLLRYIFIGAGILVIIFGFLKVTASGFLDNVTKTVHHVEEIVLDILSVIAAIILTVIAILFGGIWQIIAIGYWVFTGILLIVALISDAEKKRKQQQQKKVKTGN